MDGKKDVLEFPLEELEVPDAIKLMMQAATKCAHHGIKHEDPLMMDDDRLLLLCEKLEARVEDAIDAAKAIRDEPVEEDAPNEVEIETSDVWLFGDNQAVANIKGVVYQKACNERVYSDGATETFCIKRWGHESLVHEDEFGNEAAR